MFFLREPQPVPVSALQHPLPAMSTAAREWCRPQCTERATRLRLRPCRDGSPLRLPHDVHATHKLQGRPGGQYTETTRVFLGIFTVVSSTECILPVPVVSALQPPLPL